VNAAHERITATEDDRLQQDEVRAREFDTDYPQRLDDGWDLTLGLTASLQPRNA
jgi:hypothetical protein